MKRKRLLWQLFPSYLLLTVLSVVAVGWLAIGSFRTFYLEQTAKDLKARAEFLVPRLSGKLSRNKSAAIDDIVKRLSLLTGTRVTVILPDGVVIADSLENPERMDNHATRPEMSRALEGESASSVRYSATLQQQMMYVAVPITDQSEKSSAVIRTALPITAIEENIHDLQRDIAAGVLLVALCAALVSLLMSRRVTQPIEQMRDGAARFAEGDLSFRLKLPRPVELAQLSHALNTMASNLGEKLKDIMQQRNELDAVLASMTEGVVAIDTEQRVIKLNTSFAQMFDLPALNVTGKTVQEVVRNTELHSLVHDVLAQAIPIERELSVLGDSNLYLQASTSPLQDSEGHNIGVLIVLHDVTNLRQAEQMRKDFVANVSHELRTPITSIKGFVETLMDGALEDPENAKKFLQIIGRQTERLNAIIDDLLALSRLEREHAADLSKEDTSLAEILNSASQLCEHSAKKKSVSIHIDCDQEISANVNAPLLEQAVLNLIDNAVKYSPENTSVSVQAKKNGSKLTISVQDQGTGIDRAHLSRIFERFYRVDEGRSREQGGTGLGLAIVKHIAQVHGGELPLKVLLEREVPFR